MKKTIFAAAGICLLVLGLLFAGARYFASDYLARQITSICQRNFETVPTLGEKPAISFFPPVLTFENVDWDVYPRELNIKLQKATLELALLPLLSGDVKITRLSLDMPNVILDTRRPLIRPDHVRGKSARKSLPLEIEKIVVQHGMFSFNTKDATIFLRDIKLAAENRNLPKETDLRCDFAIETLQTASGGKVGANLAFNGAISYYAPNLTFRQASATITPLDESIAKKIAPLQVAFDGALNLDNYNVRLQDAQITSPLGQLVLKGDGALKPAAFNGQADLELDSASLSTFFLPSPLILTSPVNFKDNLLKFTSLALKIGAGNGGGDLAIQFPFNSSPPGLSGNLKIGHVQLADPPETDKNRPRKSDGQTPAFKTFPELDLKLAIESLAYKTHTIKNLDLNLFGKAGAYSLEKMNFTWCSGDVKSRIKCDLAAGQWQLLASGQNVDVGAALRSFGFDGVDNGSGGFRLNLQSSAKELADLGKGLSGKGEISVRGGKLAFMEYLVDTFSFFSKKHLDYSGANISAPFTAENGHVDFFPISVTAKDLNASAKAFINLRDNTLDSRLDIKIGALTVPLTFKGPFSDVSMGIDMHAKDY